MKKYQKFRPEPAFYTGEDEPTDIFILALKFCFWTLVVLFLLGNLLRIPSGIRWYIWLWQTHAMTAGAFTQIMLSNLVPGAVGVYLIARKSTSRWAPIQQTGSILFLVSALAAQGVMLWWYLWYWRKIVAICAEHMDRVYWYGWWCFFAFMLISVLNYCVVKAQG